jgi:LmbE family N-acetylglucosaminyl deacetylase
VLAVFAHPDDESLACGATLARLSDLGATVILLCASRGELGFVSEPSLVPSGDLGSVRTNELYDAARVLGLHTVLVLDHPDGYLRWAHAARLDIDIAAAIRHFEPDAVITFDEDGLYWHVDHVGIHERTSGVVSSLGDAAPALYYVTMKPGIMCDVAHNAISKHWVPPHAGLWSIEPAAFGAPLRARTFDVDARPWVRRKLAALQCHRSQMGSVNPFSLLNETDACEWLGIECFRRAPIAGRDTRLLEQLVDELVPSAAARTAATAV